MTLRRTLLSAVASVNLLAIGCYGYDPSAGSAPAPAPGNRSPMGQEPSAGTPAPDPGEQPPAGMTPPPDDTRPPPMDSMPPPDMTPPPDTMTPPSDPPPPPPVMDNGAAAARARMLFVTNVQPIIQAKCGGPGGACHDGAGTTPIKFMPAALTDYYLSVTSYSRVVGIFEKTTAPILTKISAGHFATYTTPEVQKIGDWLDAEKTARSMPGTGTSTTPMGPGAVAERLLREWSGCMDLQQWNASNVATAFAQLNSEQGPCIRCHVNGYESFIASTDSPRVFTVLTTHSEFMTRYFAPNVTNLATAKMEINRPLLTKVATGQAPYIEHPRFNMNAQAFTALTNFYNQTMARKNAGTCAQPRLVD